MSGTTKLMTPGGGGVNLTPASSIASDVTVNIPSQNCTLGIQGPAFSAYATGTTSVNNGTGTKVVLAGVTFDTNSCFSSSRFTPNVPGYYQVNGSIRMENIATINASIYKNGSGYAIGTTTGAGVTAYTSTVTDLIYLNGSTDYIELYAYQASGSTQTVTASASETRLSAALVRAA